MKFILLSLIILFLLTLVCSVNAQNMKVSGSIPLNFSIFDIITANSVLVTVNVTANTPVSIKASNIIDVDLNFTSNTSLGKFTINITRSLTTPVSTDLSGLYAVSLKYIITNATKKLNSSVLTWNLIKIYYTDAELNAAGIVEDSLRMYWYNTTSDRWIELTNDLDWVDAIGVNKAENYVWVDLKHFSVFGIGGLKANGQSCSSNTECYSGICCNGVCQDSCPETTTTTQVAGGGGAEAAPIAILPKKVSNFTLSENFIKVLLKPSGSLRKTLEISNTGETDLNITVDLKNLEDFLVFPGGVSEYSFDLKKGETKSIQLNFFASEDQEPGVFTGRVVISGDDIEKMITVVIEVESEKPLFDIDVEIPSKYKEVLPGEDVLIQLSIYNIKRIGRVDVNVEYGIKDWDGNIIVSEEEILSVEMQTSIVRSLDVPFDTEPDNYVVYATVKYDNTLGTGSDIFRVIPEEKKEWNMIMFFLIAIILGLVVVIIIILSLYKRKQRIYVYKRDSLRFVKDLKDRIRKKKK